MGCAQRQGPVLQVSLSLVTISFGCQSVGTSSATQTVTLSNTGEARLGIKSLMILRLTSVRNDSWFTLLTFSYDFNLVSLYRLSWKICHLTFNPYP